MEKSCLRFLRSCVLQNLTSYNGSVAWKLNCTLIRWQRSSCREISSRVSAKESVVMASSPSPCSGSLKKKSVKSKSHNSSGEDEADKKVPVSSGKECCALSEMRTHPYTSEAGGLEEAAKVAPEVVMTEHTQRVNSEQTMNSPSTIAAVNLGEKKRSSYKLRPAKDAKKSIHNNNNNTISAERISKKPCANGGSSERMPLGAWNDIWHSLPDAKHTEGLLSPLRCKPLLALSPADIKIIAPPSHLSNAVKEQTSARSTTCKESCGTNYREPTDDKLDHNCVPNSLLDKTAVGAKKVRKGALVEPDKPFRTEAGCICVATRGPFDSQTHSEQVLTAFVNPFSGKMISCNARVAKDFFRLGFRQRRDNMLRLEWDPSIFLSEYNRANTELNSKASKMFSGDDSDISLDAAKADGGTSSGRDQALANTQPFADCGTDSRPCLLNNVLTFMLRGFENSPVSWRQDLAKLMRHPDLFTAVGKELDRRYAELSDSYMPPKLDATPDSAVLGLQLTPDQANIVQLALRGYHIYVGGSAGTGKTVLLKVIFHRLAELGLRVAMTASTGVAAVQLGGCTFHHAFNVPIESFSHAEGRNWDRNALRAVDVVIIDEVSLLGAHTFDTFDKEARVACMNSAPFGDIQVIVCGDFLQLSNESTEDSLPAYMSDAFRHLLQLKLVTPMRHSQSDPLLVLLNQLRRGKFDSESFRALDKPIPSDSEQVTYIFPRRQHAQRLNQEKLGQLETSEMTFTPQRGSLFLVGHFTPSALISLPFGATALPSSADVVQIVQEEVTKAFPKLPPFFDHNCVVLPGRTSQPSLLLRWRYSSSRAIPLENRHHTSPLGSGSHSAHKTQSLTGVAGRIKDNGANTLASEEWAYVAKRVAERLQGKLTKMFEQEPISLVPLSVSMALADVSNKDVADVLLPLRLKLGCRVMVNRNLSRTVSNGSVGVVEAFMPPDISLFPHRGDITTSNYYKRTLKTKLFDSLPVVRLLGGEVVQIPPISSILGGTPATYYYGCEIFTLPLQLGYGFTVHKVQGLTLEGTVVLDCESFFDCPHLIYVACSRVKHIDKLIVRNISPKMVMVKRNALHFSENLKSAAEPQALVVPPHIPCATWVHRVNRLTCEHASKPEKL